MPAAQPGVAINNGAQHTTSAANNMKVDPAGPAMNENDYKPHVIQFNGRVVEDPNEVNSWSEGMVAGWIASIDRGQVRNLSALSLSAIAVPCPILTYRIVQPV